MAEITVVEPSNEDAAPTITTVTDSGDEGEGTWESALLEVKNTLIESFRLIRDEMETRAAKSEALVMKLLETNSNLTAQMAESQTRILDSLTRNLSRPETTIIAPPSDTPSLEDEEIVPSEVPNEIVVEEEVAAPVVRKRRTL